MRSGWALAGLTLAFLWSAPAARAQAGSTPNTLKLEKPQGSPKARLEDVAWLTGRWVGEFMGGRGEEVFAPPEGETFGCGRSLRDRRPRCFETEARYRLLGSQSPGAEGRS